MPRIEEVNTNDTIKITVEVNGQVYYVLEKLCNTETEWQDLVRKVSYETLYDMSYFSEVNS